jgi:hypothetical protein
MTTALPDVRNLRPLAQNGQSIAASKCDEAAALLRHRCRILNLG